MPAAIGTCYRRAVKPRGISEADGALPVAEVKSDVVPALASAWRQQRGKWGRLHGGRDSSAWRSLILSPSELSNTHESKGAKPNVPIFGNWHAFVRL